MLLIHEWMTFIEDKYIFSWFAAKSFASICSTNPITIYHTYTAFNNSHISFHKCNRQMATAFRGNKKVSIFTSTCTCTSHPQAQRKMYDTWRRKNQSSYFALQAGSHRYSPYLMTAVLQILPLFDDCCFAKLHTLLCYITWCMTSAVQWPWHVYVVFNN